MTTTTKSPLDALVHHLQETALLSTSNNLLDWDQETQMPAGGLEWRARQQALIARMVHERLSSMERGDLIAAVESDKAAMADAQIAALVREAQEAGMELDRGVLRETWDVHMTGDELASVYTSESELLLGD